MCFFLRLGLSARHAFFDSEVLHDTTRKARSGNDLRGLDTIQKFLDLALRVQMLLLRRGGKERQHLNLYEASNNHTKMVQMRTFNKI